MNPVFLPPYPGLVELQLILTVALDIQTHGMANADYDSTPRSI